MACMLSAETAKFIFPFKLCTSMVTLTAISVVNFCGVIFSLFPIVHATLDFCNAVIFAVNFTAHS